VLVEGGDETCFGTVSDYIHPNPARAGILGQEGMLADRTVAACHAHFGGQ
jgi:hypothetical protein